MKHDKPIQRPKPETIAGLNYYPGTDLPFGKQLQMGQVIYTIYDRAVENGFHAGVQSHLALLREMRLDTPLALGDEQFTHILNACTPKSLGHENATLWRAHFIVGWSSVFLGLADLKKVLHTEE